MRIVSIDENFIKFDNGNYLTHIHSQECCEEVYADFLYIKGYNAIESNKTVFDLEFDENILDYIEKVEDEGFKISDKKGNKIFVPCYNIQNGYYSDELFIEYYDKNHTLTKEIDITECTFYP